MSNEKKASGNTPRRHIVLPDGTVFTAYNVVKTTKAPPWAKPTTHKPAAPVDWSFWPASRRVTPEEAIALSLGLDPHSLYSNTDGHINPEFCPDNATALLFLKRLNLLADCDSRTKILLSEFAAWAVSISLAPIPPEIEAIANAAKSKETRELVKVGAGDTAVENPDIPGNLPRVAIGQLAVTAAWEIELESKRAATADKVIERLQAWATDGTHPDILLRAEPRKRAVIWMPKKTGLEKDYDVDACGKTLDTWRKSRV